MIENVSKEVMECILNTLPVEISFVDSEDTVRYFNKNGDRIFPRPRSVVERKVQNCHPSRSLHKVNEVLSELKEGKRDVVDFWIDLHGRLIYIRYFAVRNGDDKYLGCLEVSQDITDIQKIKGEKRLLD